MGQDEKRFWVVWDEYGQEPLLTDRVTKAEAANWYREEQEVNEGDTLMVVPADGDAVTKFEVVSQVREVATVVQR